MNLSDYKKEIVSALLGATFGGLASLAVGLYAGLHNVTKTFELQIKQDAIKTSKRDLVALKSVSNELNENIAIVGNPRTTIEPSLDFKPKIFPKMSQALEQKANEFKTKESKEIYGLMKLFITAEEAQLSEEDWFEIIDHPYIPRTSLITSAWISNSDISSEINFDLTLKLDNLYRRLRKINGLTLEIRERVTQRDYPEREKERIEELTKTIKADAMDLSRDMMTMKDAVTNEINRLEKLREKLTE